MSTLNELHKLRLNNPNNNDFAEAIDNYLKSHKTCCDYEKNIVNFEDNGNNPYGWFVTGTKCKECGKILTTKKIE